LPARPGRRRFLAPPPTELPRAGSGRRTSRLLPAAPAAEHPHAAQDGACTSRPRWNARTLPPTELAGHSSPACVADMPACPRAGARWGWPRPPPASRLTRAGHPHACRSSASLPRRPWPSHLPRRCQPPRARHLLRRGRLPRTHFLLCSGRRAPGPGHAMGPPDPAPRPATAASDCPRARARRGRRPPRRDSPMPATAAPYCPPPGLAEAGGHRAL